MDCYCNDRSCLRAVKLMERIWNIWTDPLKGLVYLDGRNLSTWLGNKSVYRTRMAIEDGGQLIVLAPESGSLANQENDRLIRKYGYAGRLKVLELFKENQDLQENQSVAAHLIHGSSMTGSQSPMLGPSDPEEVEGSTTTICP